jgi:6-phosphogluconolactonase
MKLIIIILVFFCFFSCKEKGERLKYDFLVGTYTKKKSQGIYFARFDSNKGEIKIISQSDSIDNPSFLTFNSNQNRIYAVCETDGGSVESLSFDRNSGIFKKLNIVSSGGAHPCHINIDKTGKWVFTGNYTGGSIGVLPILENGALGTPTEIIQHYGSGPNKDRQEKPHVHSVNISPDNKNLYVVDLGTDEIVNYAFDEKVGKLNEKQRIKVSQGSGPRHFAFHPSGRFAYAIQELTGKISVFELKDGLLNFLQEISTLPKGFEGKNACADIHVSPNGNFLYGSNRFSDTIVSFVIDQQTGKLKQPHHTTLKGKTPRNFGITPDGKYLLVANQDSDSIEVFEIEQTDGHLIEKNIDIEISMPVCIKFLN